MGAILMALVRWVGTVGAGWMVSDIYNEQQRRAQISAADGVKPSLVVTAKETLKANWIKYLIVAGVAVLALLFLNRNSKK